MVVQCTASTVSHGKILPWAVGKMLDSAHTSVEIVEAVPFKKVVGEGRGVDGKIIRGEGGGGVNDTWNFEGGVGERKK